MCCQLNYMFLFANKIKFYLLAGLVLLSFFFVADSSQAALNWGSSSSNATQTAGAAGITQATKLDAILSALVRPILGGVGIIFFLVFLYGGFKWMTAAGNDSQIGEAKKLITSAVIGLAIVTMAYVIADFIIKALEK